MTQLYRGYGWSEKYSKIYVWGVGCGVWEYENAGGKVWYMSYMEVVGTETLENNVSIYFKVIANEVDSFPTKIK